MASFHYTVKSGKKGAAGQHSNYIGRKGSFEDRGDLIATGHGNLPAWAEDNPTAFWRAGDRYERANGAVYREHEIALPAELTREQQVALAVEIVNELAADKPHEYAIHAPRAAIQGEVENVHVHLMVSDRVDDGVERSPQQTFMRYNAAYPERGGRRKDSGGKNRLEMRDALIEKRRKVAELQNTTLERHGHDARVDHRTLKEQGEKRRPEKHLGAARVRRMTDELKLRHQETRQADNGG
ncbi:MobA/MobL family protein [Achromobacter denitrificans]